MFVGQKKIKKELASLITEVKHGRNYNILLVAPSGYGKTTLAYKILSCFPLDEIEISEPPSFPFSDNFRYHFLDEVHELRTPEVLYPIMDSREFTIILATNETGELKEPLVNRCVPFIFEPYTNQDMKRIVCSKLPKLHLHLVEDIVRISKGNPRIAVILCERLEYIFEVNGYPETNEELKETLIETLNITPDGFSPLERRYMDFLHNAGGHASLDLITNSTRIDKKTILRDVEPILILSGKVEITSKGRSIVEEL
jgi:Holliday junction resolvasome RuvABC ATP-dependent DNA helicase subunit